MKSKLKLLNKNWRRKWRLKNCSPKIYLKTPKSNTKVYKINKKSSLLHFKMPRTLTNIFRPLTNAHERSRTFSDLSRTPTNAHERSDRYRQTTIGRKLKFRMVYVDSKKKYLWSNSFFETPCTLKYITLIFEEKKVWVKSCL